jgi:hypothetical protein
MLSYTINRERNFLVTPRKRSPQPRNTLSAKVLRPETSRERMSLVMPTSLMQTLLEVAAAEQRTLSATVLVLLREALDTRELAAPQ